MLSDKYFLGKGIKFPIQVDQMTGNIKMSSFEEDIKEAIQIILMTKKGERVMRPEFGCDIYKYVFAVMNYTNIQLMKAEMKSALLMWEPRITDVGVEILEDKGEIGKWNIEVTYKVRMTNNPYNLVFPFYKEEGIV